uniref:Uncharacterized protein n=1 Tax=Cacopsylla melanoneura TaxID=428564 RepID=A0A8D8XDW2_9HEMI
MIWDATCVDTLAISYISKTSQTCGAAAEDASVRKRKKYEGLSAQNFIFNPLAFETLGPWAKDTKDVLGTIGDRLISCSGNPRASSYLRQRVAIAIQRGNAASMLGTLPQGEEFEGLD